MREWPLDTPGRMKVGKEERKYGALCMHVCNRVLLLACAERVHRPHGKQGSAHTLLTWTLTADMRLVMAHTVGVMIPDRSMPATATNAPRRPVACDTPASRNACRARG